MSNATLSHSYRARWFPSHPSTEHEDFDSGFKELNSDRFLPIYWVIVGILALGALLSLMVLDVPIEGATVAVPLTTTAMALVGSAVLVAVQLNYTIRSSQVKRVRRYEELAAVNFAHLLSKMQVSEIVTALQLPHPPERPGSSTLDKSGKKQQNKPRYMPRIRVFVCQEFRIIPGEMPRTKLRWVLATTADRAFNLMAVSCGMQPLAEGDLLPYRSGAYYSHDCMVLVETANCQHQRKI